MTNSVMKEVWIARHGKDEIPFEVNKNGICTSGMWRPTSGLSEDGKRGIELVRDKHIAGRYFDFCRCSPLPRTEQTGQILFPELIWRKELHESKLGPVEDMDQWESTLEESSIIKMLKEGESERDLLREIYRLRPGLLEGEIEGVVDVVRFALDEIRVGQRALLVTHQPFVEEIVIFFDETAIFTGPLQPPGVINVLLFNADNQYLSFRTLLPPLIPK